MTPSNLKILGGTLLLLLVLFFITRNPAPTPKALESTPPTTSEPSSMPVLVPDSSPVDTVPPPPLVAITPDPEGLSNLLPEEIVDVTSVPQGYEVRTTFGAKWLLSRSDVEQLPHGMQLRIDYSRYGTGAQMEVAR